MKYLLKALILTTIIIVLSSLSFIDVMSIFVYVLHGVWDQILWIVMFLCLISGTVFLFQHQRKKSISVSCDANALPECDLMAEATKDEYVTSQDSVIQFFLRLYKQQIGATDAASSQVRVVDTKQAQTVDLDRTVELRVKHQGKWETRRMSIGALGEESGSKSKCYYVIYNINMVVKVPPKPIRRFDKYIEMIRADSRIVSQLAPKICIVPKISVIQRQLHQFPEEERYTSNALEEKYIEWLKKFETYQDYLKIGGSFVFFMDLSKHYFLGSIISRLHDIEDRIGHEISDHYHLIWDLQGFEGRYGQANSTYCLALQSFYNAFEKDIREITKQYDSASVIDGYLLKEWFLCLISKGKIDFEQRNLSGSMISQVNQSIALLEKEQGRHLDTYRKMIEAYISKLSLSQNKSSFGGIIANLIQLLVWLEDRGVAMRDLKPDNLLVVGDPDQFPHFLNFSEKFSIGLIDVETAVIFKDEKGKIGQPQLGGTPFYATPSHLLRNEYIEQIFGDIALILHHQDWHAIMVIIFKVMTGKRLFDRSGKLFAEMIKTVRSKSFAKDGRLDKNTEEISRSFWTTARAEFQFKMNQHKELLKSIRLNLLKKNIRLFLAKASKEKAFIENLTHTFVTRQTLFKGEAHQAQFLNANAKKIHQLSVKWEKENTLKKMSDEQKKNAFAFLKDLEKLKEKSERYRHFLDSAESNQVILSAYEWLFMMFDINLSVMYQRKWGLLNRVKIHIDEGSTTELSGATL